MIGDFRNTLLLINFFLLLLLNYGYIQLRIPQAQIGVPISEWLLLLTLLTVHHPRVLGRMRDGFLLLPYVLWLGYGAIIILLSYFEHGIRAVRDLRLTLTSSVQKKQTTIRMKLSARRGLSV